jgi:hypothetical protein
LRPPPPPPPPLRSTPTGIDAATLRSYLLKLKLNKNIKWDEWATKKKEQEEEELRRKQKEFQKALHGQEFSLDEADWQDMVASFNVVPDDVLRKEIHARAVEWLSGPEGVRETRKVRQQQPSCFSPMRATNPPPPPPLRLQKAADAELRKGSSYIIDEDDKAQIVRDAKLETLSEKKQAMTALEFPDKPATTDAPTPPSSAFFPVTKSMFQEYITLCKRKHYTDTEKFSDWCKARQENRARVKEARKDWVESKEEARKRKETAGSKVAAVADVEELVKDLVAAAQQETVIGARGEKGVNVVKPSRKGIELAKKLHEIQRLSGEGKVVSKATFDTVMKDVIFSLMADKKTAKQAKVSERERERASEGARERQRVDTRERRSEGARERGSERANERRSANGRAQRQRVDTRGMISNPLFAGARQGDHGEAGLRGRSRVVLLRGGRGRKDRGPGPGDLREKEERG